MGFFEVMAKCGHVGVGRYYRATFYVQAENGKAAAALVRTLPRVKHDHKDAIIAVTKVDYAVFQEGNTEHHADSYFNCRNKQEQSLFLAKIEENIHYETDIDKGERRDSSDRRAKRKAMHRYYRKMDKYSIYKIGA
jgi:hypothetical protein